MKKTAIYLTMLLLGFGFIFSCAKDEVSENDPVIGTWNLKEIKAGSQSVDVSNMACYGSSTLTFTETYMTLILKAPVSEGSTQCESETTSFKWKRNGNNYVLTDDEASDYFSILVTPGEVQLTASYDGGSSTFVFRK